MVFEVSGESERALVFAEVTTEHYKPKITLMHVQWAHSPESVLVLHGPSVRHHPINFIFHIGLRTSDWHFKSCLASNAYGSDPEK